MSKGPNPPRSLPWIAAAVGGLGLVVLAGWAAGVERLQAVLPGQASMKPNTALGLLSFGVALGARCLPGRSVRAVGWLAAGLGLAIGVATLAQYVSGIDLHIDEALFHDLRSAPGTSSPGRPSPLTATAFCLAGAAFFLLDARGGRRQLAHPAELLALGVGLIGFSALLGYLLGIDPLYSFFGFTQVALHTAVGLLAIATGLLASRPERGLVALLRSPHPVGRLTRRLLLALVAILVGLTWVKVRLESAGAIGPDESLAVHLIGEITLACAVVLAFAQVAERADAERRGAEAEVREREERLDLAIRGADLGAWSWDLRTGALRWDARTRELFGVGPAEPLTYPRFLDSLHPDDRERIDAHARVSLERHADFRAEMRVVRPDGTLCWVSAMARGAYDDAGQAVRMHGVVQDVSLRKADELEKARLAQSLEDRVAERTRELGERNAELEAFSWSVAHDLRAPLRAIAGYAELVLATGGEQLGAEGRAWLGRIRHAVERMSRLIDGLLRLTGVTRAPLRLDVVDLTRLAREIAGALERRDPDRRVEWRIEEGLTASGDRDLLRIALENLLENAWKYTSRLACGHISFGTRLDGGTLVYQVRDDGAGFDMGHAGQLFRPFTRLHGEEFPGSGIGLVIVERIVGRHGGRIWAEASPDRGATLPAPGDQPPRASTNTPR